MRPKLPRLLAFVLTLLVVLGFTGQAQAAVVDTFVQIPEIPGDSADAKFPGSIVAKEYEEHVAGSTRTFSFTSVVSKATPKLFGAAMSGQVLKTLTVSERKAGTSQVVFFVVKFENVRITSVTSSLTGVDVPVIRTTFTCDRATWTFYPTRADGSVDTANAVTYTADFRAAVAPMAIPEIPRLR